MIMWQNNTKTVDTNHSNKWPIYVMYRLYHRLSGYTGIIPEVVTDKARGRSPRALSVTTEGISQYSQACLWYNLFVAKATGAFYLNRF